MSNSRKEIAEQSQKKAEEQSQQDLIKKENSLSKMTTFDAMLRFTQDNFDDDEIFKHESNSSYSDSSDVVEQQERQESVEKKQKPVEESGFIEKHPLLSLVILLLSYAAAVASVVAVFTLSGGIAAALTPVAVPILQALAVTGLAALTVTVLAAAADWFLDTFIKPREVIEIENEAEYSPAYKEEGKNRQEPKLSEKLNRLSLEEKNSNEQNIMAENAVHESDKHHHGFFQPKNVLGISAMLDFLNDDDKRNQLIEYLDKKINQYPDNANYKELKEGIEELYKLPAGTDEKPSYRNGRIFLIMSTYTGGDIQPVETKMNKKYLALLNKNQGYLTRVIKLFDEGHQFDKHYNDDLLSRFIKRKV